MTQDRFFNQTWTVYQKVVEGDYLEHQAALRLIREAVGPDTPASVLELGCGDGTFTEPLLTEWGVERYLGIDLSGEALADARGRLERHPGWRVQQGDVVEAVEGLHEPYDLVLSAYCLHHLSAESKARLMRALPAQIRKGGRFVLLDLFLHDELRTAFLERRHAWIRADWDRLTPAERESVMAHELASDFPESPAFYRDLGLAVGLGPCTDVPIGPQRAYRLLVWTR